MIELTNLMLGDYVLCNDKVCRVKEVGGMACVAPVDDEEEELFCNAEDIEPIPLTAEILKKNFPTSEVVAWWPIVSDDHKYIEYHCETRTDGDIMASGTFHYVYELQHALCLCQIDKIIEL